LTQKCCISDFLIRDLQTSKYPVQWQITAYAVAYKQSRYLVTAFHQFTKFCSSCTLPHSLHSSTRNFSLLPTPAHVSPPPTHPTWYRSRWYINPGVHLPDLISRSPLLDWLTPDITYLNVNALGDNCLNKFDDFLWLDGYQWNFISFGLYYKLAAIKRNNTRNRDVSFRSKQYFFHIQSFKIKFIYFY